jgi:hypothetical protein
MSEVRATVDNVQVTARDVERIPPGNLRVPRDEFVTVWAAAERAIDAGSKTGVRAESRYELGVAFTCRWLAGAIVPGLNGEWEPARAPVSGRTSAAHEELIEYETFAAERSAMRHPD